MRRPVSGQFVHVFETELVKKSKSHVVIEGGSSVRTLLKKSPRVLRQGEIHQLFVTDEKNAKPGGTIIKYYILGDFEVTIGGSILVGDSVLIRNKKIGNVAGYEACETLRAPLMDLVHIFLASDKMSTANEIDLKLGDRIVFNPSTSQ